MASSTTLDRSSLFLSVLALVSPAASRGCPWENGYQESFYGKFKAEFGDPERFKTLGELVAEIYLAIHRYNTLRIHSALQMAPRQFAQLHARYAVTNRPKEWTDKRGSAQM